MWTDFVCPDDKKTCASSVSFLDAEEDLQKWRKLEELIIVSSNGTLPQHFKPSIQCFTNRTNNNYNPVAIIGGRKWLTFMAACCI